MEAISIVVPALNEASWIRRTLAALQPFRSAGHEVIVVDGGSTDGTPELAAPLADQLLETGPGRAPQMNAGAARAGGAVLWFVHADTLAPPEAAAQILMARAHDRRWGRFDVRLDSRRPLLRLVAAMMNARSALSGIATGDQGLFVERGLFHAVSGFPEIALMEDIALSRRLRAICRPARLRGPLVTSSRRWEHRGAWHTILLMWWLRLAYRAGVDPARLARRYR